MESMNDFVQTIETIISEYENCKIEPATTQEIKNRLSKAFIEFLRLHDLFNPSFEVVACSCGCGKIDLQPRNFQTFLALNGIFINDAEVLKSNCFKTPEYELLWLHGYGFVRPYCGVEKYTVPGNHSLN